MIVAACILALSVVTGSFLIKSSVDDGAQLLDAVLKEMQASARVAAPTPARREARPGRPDPAKRYEIALGDAPTRGGPDTARVKIVEWSDFQ
jgi:hypothetical protein